MKGASFRQIFNGIYPNFNLPLLIKVSSNYDYIKKNQKFGLPYGNSVEIESFNVMIDGLMIVYYAYKNIKIAGHHKKTNLDELLAATCLNIVKSLIGDWSLYININKVTLLFDAEKPIFKTKLSYNGMNCNYSYYFSIEKVIEYMTCYSRYITQFVNYTVVSRSCIYGEGDFGVYFERDINYPTIIVVNDGDVFLTVVNHNPLTSYDKVFLYAFDKDQFFLPTKKISNLSKDAFQSLILLLGSDYTPQIYNKEAIPYIKSFYYVQNVQSKKDFEKLLITFYNYMIESDCLNECLVNEIVAENYKEFNQYIPFRVSYENLINILYNTFILFSKGINLKDKDPTRNVDAVDFFEYLKYKKLHKWRKTKSI